VRSLGGKIYQPQELEDEQTVILRDAAFRKIVVSTYNHTCAFCGLQILDTEGRNIVDGSHIKPFSQFYDDRIDNGLSLCKNHRWAFDRYWFSINDDYTIMVSENLREESPNAKPMRQFRGERLSSRLRFALYCQHKSSIIARGSASFSPVMVGQRYQINRLSKLANVELKKGWETSNLRKHLGLHKEKSDKSLQIPETHAVDAVTLACSEFVQYKSWEGTKNHGANWVGNVTITQSQFPILRRPPISRRQLHLMVPSKGGNRRKYGGTTTRHGFRKGDFVEAAQGKKSFFGWVSGDTEKQVSVSDCNWKRLGQCTAKKVRLIQRNTGLIVLSTRKMFNLTAMRFAHAMRTNH
jgi:HNH endonuclease